MARASSWRPSFSRIIARSAGTAGSSISDSSVANRRSASSGRSSGLRTEERWRRTSAEARPRAMALRRKCSAWPGAPRWVAISPSLARPCGSSGLRRRWSMTCRPAASQSPAAASLSARASAAKVVTAPTGPPGMLVSRLVSFISEQLSQSRRLIVDQRAVARPEAVRQFDPDAGQILARGAALPAIGADPHAVAPVARALDAAGVEQGAEELVRLRGAGVADMADQRFIGDDMDPRAEPGGGVHFIDVAQRRRLAGQAEDNHRQ